VRQLLNRNYQVHTHLDWQDTDHWLEAAGSPMRLAWHNEQLVGLMATSDPLNRTCWMRLVAVHEDSPVADVLRSLWDSLSDELYVRGVRSVALLTMRNWIERYASEIGLRYVEDIITLSRSGGYLPDLPPSKLIIRAAENNDIDTITQVDQAAFAPPWQLSLSEVRQAHRMAAVSTVALLDGKIAGYQISTAHRNSAHLARLAVNPNIQSKGIGAALVRDVLERFLKRDIKTMTVNTQSSNHRSQRLYNRFGFHPNGYDMPVWMREL
jgi:[ribosomal protein S18]-alanine N-acetyltransferase